jgi:mannosyl-oligosaccharide alpha-1,2-mannosidase
LYSLHEVAPPVQQRNVRLDAVVEAISWAWDGYYRIAKGHDELKPLSQTGDDAFCGFDATAVDSLSTLWLAGLDSRFDQARVIVDGQDYSNKANCNLFESTIRILGGLLSAGALAKDEMFYWKAMEIAELMMPSFATPTGIPCNAFPLQSAGCGSANLAESGTLVMEFAYLAHVTNHSEYQEVAEKAMRAIALGRNTTNCMPGIYSSAVSTQDGTGSGCWGTMGGGADSFYEYMLKIWLLANKHPSFEPYKRMWDLSMRTTRGKLMRCSDAGHLYITSGDGSTFNNNVEHLACFLGGNMVLGAPLVYLKEAAAITESCVAMYTATASGLGADGMMFQGNGPIEKCIDSPLTHEGADVSFASTPNLQRPETVESLFYLWKETRNEVYRTMAWDIFIKLNTTRLETGGFASVQDVNRMPIALQDRQQSFFIAEE